MIDDRTNLDLYIGGACHGVVENQGWSVDVDRDISAKCSCSPRDPGQILFNTFPRGRLLIMCLASHANAMPLRNPPHLHPQVSRFESGT